MARKPIPTTYVAAVVVQHGDRFLLVQERKRGSPWSLPAGRVEPGETMVEGAVREALEESGVLVRVTGLLRIEHTPEDWRARLRAVFVGVPEGDTTTKQQADEESLGAAWVAIEELAAYPLRSQEVEQLLRYVSAGGPVYPLDLLRERGAPYGLAADEPNESPERGMGRRDSAIVRAARWLREAVAAADREDE
ncbi:MAG TPA: NUDIX domain-containing protein [Gemmatimonadaceae bacterium]